MGNNWKDKIDVSEFFLLFKGPMWNSLGPRSLPGPKRGWHVPGRSRHMAKGSLLTSLSPFWFHSFFPQVVLYQQRTESGAQFYFQLSHENCRRSSCSHDAASFPQMFQVLGGGTKTGHRDDLPAAQIPGEKLCLCIFFSVRGAINKQEMVFGVVPSRWKRNSRVWE